MLRKRFGTPLLRSALTPFLAFGLAFLASVAPANAVAQQPQQFPMPRLTGLTPRRATALLTNARLRLTQIDTAYSADTTGIGTIIDQKPGAGTPVTTGTAVSVVIKQYRPPAPPKLVLVQDLKGRDVRAAQNTLAALGLRLDKPTMQDRYDVPFGIVLDQKPAGGDSVRLGSAVSVLIASDATVVPQLTGSLDQDAQAILARYSLKLGGSKTVESAAADPGVVLAQYPATDTRVRKGSLVSIDVAVAPPPPPPRVDSVAVPALVRRTLADARVALANAGLSIAGAQNAADEQARIAAQNPAAGVRVPAGTAVTVTLAAAPVTTVFVSVPDLTGLSAQAARDRLTGVGLLLVLRQPIRTSSVPARTIAAQQPSSGSTARRGSVVFVNVAQAPIPWVPVTGGFAAGALVFAAAMFVTRGRRLQRKNDARKDRPAVAEPLLEFSPHTVALDAQLRARDLVSPYSLELVGALDEERSAFDLSYDVVLTKEGADE